MHDEAYNFETALVLSPMSEQTDVTEIVTNVASRANDKLIFDSNTLILKPREDIL